MNIEFLTILEIGCGMGTDSIMFAKGGADVTGVDLTENAVKTTSNRFKLYNFNNLHDNWNIRIYWDNIYFKTTRIK